MLSDLVTGWGTKPGGKGPSFVIHSKRLRAKLGWIWQKLDYLKASSERCLREHQGKWIVTLTTRPVRSCTTVGRLSGEWAMRDERI